LRKNSIAVALGLCAVMLLATAAPAQRKRTAKAAPKKMTSVSGAETGLAGIKLFDSGIRLVAVYGSPDEIQAVTLGGGGAGPGGGAGGGAGGRGLPGGGGPPGTPASAGAPNISYSVPGVPNDFDFGGAVPDRQGIPGEGPTMAKPGGGNAPKPGGGGGGGGGGVGGSGGGGNAGGMGGSGDRVVYTRWVYNRNASKYSFILDKFNHVVQCEAIGMVSGKARTRRGITFGSSFAQIIKKYGAPDGYEIAGDNIVVRYLSKSKCAFRLSRLGENKPNVVTGIVVAAGKR
jgi:hypothetical protein